MKKVLWLSVWFIATALLWSCAEKSAVSTENISNDPVNSFNRTSEDPSQVAQFEIVLENLSPATGPGASQPFSPPVLATHSEGLHIFKVGEFASNELQQLAEDAVSAPMVTFLNQSPNVFRVVEGTGVILPGSSASFTIEAKRGYHKLSLICMLVNTNDGFTGINGINLPRGQSKVVYLHAFDAGTESNTESTAHIPGPCCGNPLVRVPTHEEIDYHSGIQGVGDLDPMVYGWDEPVARLTITRID